MIHNNHITNLIIILLICLTGGMDINELLLNNSEIRHNNEEFNLLILHTNDMHSRILETTESSAPICRDVICYGGFARLKTAYKKIKEKYEKENWSVLFLNAGDNFQGSPFYGVHKWRVLSDLIPDLGFDVMVSIYLYF